MSSLSAKLLNMAECLDVDLGPSEDDRTALRDAAKLLSARSLGEVAMLLLTDKDALRAGLAQLTPAQVGVVLGMTLSRVNEIGDTPLPELVRVLTGQIEELVATMEER